MYNEQALQVRAQIWYQCCDRVVARCRRTIADNFAHQTRKICTAPPRLEPLASALLAARMLGERQAWEDYDV